MVTADFILLKIKMLSVHDYHSALNVLDFGLTHQFL